MAETSGERMDHPDHTNWLEPTPVEPLAGEEDFSGIDATVAEFWRWGFSDLRNNVLRGVLAEFIVAKAVGAQDRLRVSWDNFDVVSAAGTRIEVKSSAYLQSWSQRQLSTITFTGLTGLRWEAKEGFSDERDVRADVFVFAIQTCRDPALYDALDVDQWRFHVVSADDVREYGTRSVGMTFLRRYAPEPVGFDGLAEEIDAAATGLIS